VTHQPASTPEPCLPHHVVNAVGQACQHTAAAVNCLCPRHGLLLLLLGVLGPADDVGDNGTDVLHIHSTPGSTEQVHGTAGAVHGGTEQVWGKADPWEWVESNICNVGIAGRA
jgi:hypothetical protein